MRKYFGFVSMFLTSILFFSSFSRYIHFDFFTAIFILSISIILAILAPKGDTAKKITFTMLIILGILIACVLIIATIIGAGLAESQLQHLK
ncbi:TPA: hypothetical protein QC116_003168 [Bacillus thuringiensis]|uniref:hypothetical protein n=1 Tax=Bacillus TaxID=1386 RepID=UPI00027AB3AD|nr:MULTISPECIES: hypothetical protein [Bacillus]EJS68077.1 hypothetical protein ICU_02674 [Bacillus cereus BAG2X1-1]HDR8183743.1 hypothetical protein [Bacillus thuringiensis]MDA2029862.1 hypothetical protein [Bacillus cereus group sp. Bcc03]MDA2219775.1 hypothetical protein [Bacillus cereus group sp. Bc228]MDA2264111.1 hypothetical protein [Bacillus cereus group sp. Bc200]